MKDKKTIRVKIPVDVEIDAKHLKEIHSKEWKSQMYDFSSDEEIGLYIARLMIKRFETASLNSFDGHADQVLDVAVVRLADIDDQDWQVK